MARARRWRVYTKICQHHCLVVRSPRPAPEKAPRFGTETDIGDGDRNLRTRSATAFACNVYHKWSEEKGYPEAEHDFLKVPADLLPERLKDFALQVLCHLP